MSTKNSEKNGENGENGEKTLKNIRKQVKNYYDAVSDRAEELEEPRPVWGMIHQLFPTLLGWGKNIIYTYEGEEVTPPRGLRDELKFTRQELKLWSTVHKLETRKNEEK